MSGHIRKRKRKDGTVVCQARHTDPVRGGTHKIERTFRTKQEAEDWLVDAARVRPRRHVHRPAARESVPSPRSSRRGRSPGATDSARRPPAATRASSTSTCCPSSAACPSAASRTRSSSATSTGSLRRSRPERARTGDGAQRLRRAPHRDGEGRAHGSRSGEPVHGHRPAARAAARRCCS